MCEGDEGVSKSLSKIIAVWEERRVFGSGKGIQARLSAGWWCFPQPGGAPCIAALVCRCFSQPGRLQKRGNPRTPSLPCRISRRVSARGRRPSGLPGLGRRANRRAARRPAMPPPSSQPPSPTPPPQPRPPPRRVTLTRKPRVTRGKPRVCSVM